MFIQLCRKISKKEMIVTINIEEIYTVDSTLKNAKKNLKKLEKIYNHICNIDYKKLQESEIIQNVVYYEVWFMFMDEIIQVQTDLIKNGRLCETMETMETKINRLIKPISVSISKFHPPQIKLFIPIP